jgi:hypothetical protein
MITARPELEAISGIAILIAVSWICSAGAEEAPSFDLPDWLGAGPIYSYGDYRSPYFYPYYYPYYRPYYDDSHLIYSPSPAYSDPFRTLPYARFAADFGPRNQFRPWWVGAHEGLPKVIDIARSSSSMRVFVNGAWQTL